MLKSFTEKIYKALTGRKGPLLDSSTQQELLTAAKYTRSKDYVVEFDFTTGGFKTAEFTTFANWRFILTGVAIFFVGEDKENYPKIGIDFVNYVPKTPLNTPVEDIGTAPASLVYGCETDGERFEEYKNLYYYLGQRFDINVNAKAVTPGFAGRGYVLVTGIEFNGDVGEFE